MSWTDCKRISAAGISCSCQQGLCHVAGRASGIAGQRPCLSGLVERSRGESLLVPEGLRALHRDQGGPGQLLAPGLRQGMGHQPRPQSQAACLESDREIMQIEAVRRLGRLEAIAERADPAQPAADLKAISKAFLMKRMI